MTARKGIEVGLKTIVVATGLTIIFMIAAMVSGLGRSAPHAAATSAATAGQAAGAGQQGNVLLLLFAASLVQAIVVAYVVLEAKWSGWKVAGALFLLVLNLWAQAGIEPLFYLRNRLPPKFSTQMLVAGLVAAALFAPFAVWILGGFRRATPEEPSEHAHWSAARWIGTLAATTVAFVALYYLCGYYIAWQNPALRKFYSGTTETRSFWGQIAWTWSSTPWTFAVQAGRGILFVLMTLPAVRMLRGGAARVAFGTALLYAAWDGSVGLIMPNPILPPTVAHTHLVELAIWGLMFGACVGGLVGRRSPAPPPTSRNPDACAQLARVPTG